MGLNDILRAIANRQEQRKRERVDEYEALVEQIADEAGEPEAGYVEDVLQRAGKTVNDLQADVALLLERRRLKSLVDAEPALKAEHEEILARIDKERAKFFRAREAWHRAHEDLDRQRQSVVAQLGRCTAARTKLLDTAPGVNQEVARIHASTRQDRQEIAELEIQLRRARGELEGYQRQRDKRAKARENRTSIEGVPPNIEQLVANSAGKVSNLEYRVAERQRRVDEARRQIEALNDRILTP